MQAEIIVEFDENSNDFKGVLEAYKSCIDSNADDKAISENIACAISRYGIAENIEGVGYVKHNGNNPEIYKNGDFIEYESCINVEVNTDLNGMVEFEAHYIEDLSDEVDTINEN